MDTAVTRTTEAIGRPWGPVAGALALLVAVFGITTAGLLHETGGHFAYALDDAYIHMAIAKNLARHGVWGVQADAFAAASSSPLWTALLGAVFAVVGVHERIPLLLAGCAAVLVIVAADAILRREQVQPPARFAVLTMVVLLTPLVPMIWIGMEHALHILLVLLTTWIASRPDKANGQRLAVLLILTAAMVATRYEGLFVALGCAVVFAMSRRWMAAAAICAAALLPVIVVGIWNMSHGWFFLPASIVMKQGVLSASPDASALQGIVHNVVATDAPLTFLIVVAAVVAAIAFSVRAAGARGVHPLLVIFIVTAMQHFLLARFGWLYRYESYLIALGVLALGVSMLSLNAVSPSMRRMFHDWPSIMLGMTIVVLVGGDRTIGSLAATSITAGHIYRQQRQMARFIGQYYNSDRVALNDIGAVSYFTDAHVFDLIGLGSVEAARTRYEGAFTATQINRWLDQNHVELAIVYDEAFAGDAAFQRQWQRVGTWQTDTTGLGETTVTFFARNAEAAARLRTQMLEFNQTLPPRIDARVVLPGP